MIERNYFISAKVYSSDGSGDYYSYSSMGSLTSWFPDPNRVFKMFLKNIENGLAKESSLTFKENPTVIVHTFHRV